MGAGDLVWPGLGNFSVWRMVTFWLCVLSLFVVLYEWKTELQVLIPLESWKFRV